MDLLSTAATRAARPAALAAVAATAAPAWYLGGLTLLSSRPHRCGRSTSTRFSIVVPAHDEAECIEATLASITALQYPADLFDVTVVADNCADDTAGLARRAGVNVIERHNRSLRGKGHALDTAFSAIVAQGWADAVVVIDADTVVDSQLLAHAAFHLDAGAAALQVDYRIRNPAMSWRTRLIDLAFTCKHRVRSRGREVLGASAGLRGNGMVFPVATLESTPYAAFSVVEDVEYAIALAQQDIVVAHCDATSVSGDMPSTAAAAQSQRLRWELGNQQLRRTHGWPMLRRAVRTRRIVHADMALDVLIAPLATVALVHGAATALVTVGRFGFDQRVWRRGTVQLALAGWLGLGLHLCAGIVQSQSGWRCVPAMARAPFYVAWKTSLRLSKASRDQQSGELEWTRTQRSADALVNASASVPHSAAPPRPTSMVPA